MEYSARNLERLLSSVVKDADAYFKSQVKGENRCPWASVYRAREVIKDLQKARKDSC